MTDPNEPAVEEVPPEVVEDELRNRLGNIGAVLAEQLATNPEPARENIRSRLETEEFTPSERARIRRALGIDVLADIGITEAQP